MCMCIDYKLAINNKIYKYQHMIKKFKLEEIKKYRTCFTDP